MTWRCFVDRPSERPNFGIRSQQKNCNLFLIKRGGVAEYDGFCQRKLFETILRLTFAENNGVVVLAVILLLLQL